MKAAPLKGDCLICQAPEPTRVAINAAIWPGDGYLRAVDYRSAAVDLARTSKVPELARLNLKTVRRHAEHIEASWREIPRGGRMNALEVPVATDFGTVMDRNIAVGNRATQLIADLLTDHGEMIVALEPSFVLDVATKLGVGAASKREAARLKGRGQAIDVMALFALSSGHASPPDVDGEVADAIEALEAEVAAERKRLTERASA